MVCTAWTGRMAQLASPPDEYSLHAGPLDGRGLRHSQLVTEAFVVAERHAVLAHLTLEPHQASALTQAQLQIDYGVVFRMTISVRGAGAHAPRAQHTFLRCV